MPDPIIAVTKDVLERKELTLQMTLRNTTQTNVQINQSMNEKGKNSFLEKDDRIIYIFLNTLLVFVKVQSREEKRREPANI